MLRHLVVFYFLFASTFIVGQINYTDSIIITQKHNPKKNYISLNGVFGIAGSKIYHYYNPTGDLANSSPPRKLYEWKRIPQNTISLSVEYNRSFFLYKSKTTALGLTTGLGVIDFKENWKTVIYVDSNTTYPKPLYIKYHYKPTKV